MKETMKLIEVGFMAFRDPETKEFGPKIPLYAESTAELKAGEEKLTSDIGKVFAQKMKQYIDGGGIVEGELL